MREPSQPAPASVPELRAPSEQGSQRVAEAASLRRKSTTKQMEAIVQNARGAGNEAVRKTKEQLAYEKNEMGFFALGHNPAMAGFIDRDSGYRGERASAFSFCFQFPDIICKLKGSVFPNILVEISIATIRGATNAQWRQESDTTHQVGHQIAGTLLSFLVVFRSQIAWNMYHSGYTAFNTLRSISVNLSNATLTSLIARCAESGEPLPPEAYEVSRLLKLFFFLVVEHVRSSEGEGAWIWVQYVAYSFAHPHEIVELQAEVCGQPAARTCAAS
uniref:Uncharacterized protein n=1 Tax=Prymnesium polylepis TaxID=72548 RepID=A0A7S4HSC6_9EUKA